MSIMALDDTFVNLNFFLRWIHIFAAIIWVGLLYFFNFVNAPTQAKLSAEDQQKINPILMPRALWWFRWAAMTTWLIGITLLLHKYTLGDLWTDSDESISGRAIWILFGFGLGTIMWFNVWFIIWPSQKKILSGAAGAQTPFLKKRAALASKINTFLSAPLLFAMIAPNNYGAFSWPSLVVVTLIGFLVIKLLYVLSNRVE